MLKQILFYSTLVLVVSCSSNAPLQIFPILGKRTYAANEVPKHIEGYYYIENFRNTKNDIVRMFHVIEDEIEPNYRSENLFKAVIVENKNDVYIDDGVAFVDSNSIYVLLDSLKNYYKISFSVKDQVYSHKFKKKNKCQYDYYRDDNRGIVSFNYKELSLNVLQVFMNIVLYEREKEKKRLGQYTYQLQHKESDAIDCEIIYYNDPEKGLNNVFKIRFP